MYELRHHPHPEIECQKLLMRNGVEAGIYNVEPNTLVLTVPASNAERAVIADFIQKELALEQPPNAAMPPSVVNKLPEVIDDEDDKFSPIVILEVDE